MSSVGHVFDMIRRDKENRELRKNRGSFLQSGPNLVKEGVIVRLKILLR